MKSKGVEKDRLNVFGTVSHDWQKMIARFMADDKFVAGAQLGDELYLQREVGSNKQLIVDNLEMVLILA